RESFSVGPGGAVSLRSWPCGVSRSRGVAALCAGDALGRTPATGGEGWVRLRSLHLLSRIRHGDALFPGPAGSRKGGSVSGRVPRPPRGDGGSDVRPSPPRRDPPADRGQRRRAVPRALPVSPLAPGLEA